jgi:hypothetical protein
MKTINSLKVMLVIASTLMLFSCEETGKNSRIPLTLSTNMASTRSPYFNNKWDGGETVMTYIDGAYDAAGNLLEAKEYAFTAGSDGSLTPPSDLEMYWPESGGVTVYAYYSAQTFGTSWSIKTDQSTDENLEASDFIYATSGGTPLTETARELAFYHQETQITVNLIRDASLSEEDFATVNLTFYGYTTRKPVLSASSSTDTYCSWTTEATWGAITPQMSGNIYTVLLVPCTMPSGTAFFEISMLNGTRTTPYTLPQEFEMLPGHTYNYNVTITDTGIKVKVVGVPDINENTETSMGGTLG